MFKVIGAAIVATTLILYGLVGITNIEPGEAGLLVKMVGSARGMQKETLGTGTHWIEPISYDVPVYDTRFRQYKIDQLPAQTKDGQPILVDISFEIGLDAKSVPNLHERVGRDYFQQVVYPAARATVRNETATQLSDAIYTGEGRAAVQDKVDEILSAKLAEYGILINVNLRDVQFTDADFRRLLEQKAGAAQKVIIAERNAEAAVNQAKQTANIAEGEKQKRIKAAEADREERRLQGEGERLKKEEEAKGILAVAKAEAEGTRLQVKAYGDGKTYASVKWAENLGPNVKVYGFPTGAAGTASFMDLNGVFKGVFPSGTVGK
jgi:regulator of protease activity HflC (stomatin/prohibitin superfamily)